MNQPGGPIPRKTAVVGMSGGVDSSVAAWLAREAGYRVIGLFMRNWQEIDGACSAAEDYADVARVCDRLGVEYHGMDFSKPYWDRVFESFLEDHRAGLTPNPDVLCNREIKFDVFAKAAQGLGAEIIATGHYARLGRDESGRPRLLKAIDSSKDQTYFLHAVSREQLQPVEFPVGELPKTRVRELAARLELATATKKDSTGICFIGERKFRDFLTQYLKPRPGAFIRLDGTRVGTHQGAHLYTLGQRRGLGLGGEGESWYVVEKNIELNTVVVERGADHPALFAESLVMGDPHWITPEPPAEDEIIAAKIRYRQADQACRIRGQTVFFENPQRAITPGQYVVFYRGDECLGGARILSAGLSLYRQRRTLPGLATHQQDSDQDHATA